MTVGLVLEGGGMRGMFTAGVLDALMEQNIQIDKNYWRFCGGIIWHKLCIQSKRKSVEI